MISALLALTLAAAPPAYQRQSCSLEAVVEQIRSGLHSSSPAYQRYLRTLLGRTAAALPEAGLRSLFEAEKDPAMLEELGAAMALRTDRLDEPASLQSVAARALSDADPKARAALVRSLRRTSTLENTDGLYQRLLKDPSPEVRREAARNLIEDNQFVYAGQAGHAADTAVSAALGSADPALTAEVLRSISTESISASTAQQLRGALKSDSAELRAAAATALGGVPAAEMTGARDALAQLFRTEKDPAVKRALVAGVARLGFSGSVPLLQQLGATDPSLRPEIDLWVRALNTGLQEWSLVLREKQRLEAH